MPTYVALINFTEQGVRNFRETRQRADNFRAMAGEAGVTVREVFWLLGRYDGLLLLDAPDEATVTGLMLALGALGNVRTDTLRAFDAAEMASILDRMPGAAGASRGSSGWSSGATSGGASSGGGRGASKSSGRSGSGRR
jgi:uncharacterized protein with GYD domain